MPISLFVPNLCSISPQKAFQLWYICYLVDTVFLWSDLKTLEVIRLRDRFYALRCHNGNPLPQYHHWIACDLILSRNQIVSLDNLSLIRFHLHFFIGFFRKHSVCSSWLRITFSSTEMQERRERCTEREQNQTHRSENGLRTPWTNLLIHFKYFLDDSS